ncbi:MAG: beta-galactosidase [Sandaracinaceae bacterium]
MSRPPKRASARRKSPRSKSPRGVQIRGRALEVGDRTVPLYSGAMHYWRLDRAAWEPGLEQLRDLGLPIVETYVPWQVHETAPGEFDFGEGDPRHDLGAFLDLAHELGLLAFVRPGPHINAEMTWFGLPERIIYDAACQARSPRQSPVIQGFPPRMFPVPSYASETFHEEAGRWFDAVGEVVQPRLWPKGPVVLLQVDNEGSFYFRDSVYDQDYHPDAIAMWRKFLEKRYRTLKATSAAHRQSYRTWADATPPVRFEAEAAEGLVRHLDWVEFREHLLTRSIDKMKRRMHEAGMRGPVTVHNFPLGDQGVALSSPALDEVVDLVGFDYYHARREHSTIKRRTLYIAGTHTLPYAPELGVGAPAWFTPLSNDDSLFTAMTALAYGLRGFNLYMAVDRDRWYGAPIDGRGNPRVDAGTWKHLLGELQGVGFHQLSRRVEVGLMLPREYSRLSKATSLLGFLSPTVLEATLGNPVIGCREEDFGFDGPVQVLWWKMLARLAHALTEAGVPYVYVDSDAPVERLASLRVLVTPSYEFADPVRWKHVSSFAENGGTVVYGPAMPTLDARANRTLFEVPKGGRRVLIDTEEDARDVVGSLVSDLALERPFPIEPAPLETAVHQDASGPRVLFVMNPGKEPAHASVELPAPLAFEDMMSGERLTGTTQLSVAIEGWSCRMFRIVGGAGEHTGQGEAVAS